MWKPNFLAVCSVASERLKVVKPKFYVPLEHVWNMWWTDRKMCVTLDLYCELG